MAEVVAAFSSAHAPMMSADRASAPPEQKVADPVPLRCQPGSVVKDGACAQVVTAEKVAAVGQQASRLDELAALMSKVDVAAAPIELLGGFRQLEVWQKLVARSASVASLDQVVGVLGEAVTELRAFKEGLSATSGRLTNLQGELNKLMTDSGASQKLEDVRARISSEVQGVIGPFEQQVRGAMGKVTTPLVTRLGELGDLVAAACVMANTSGASAQTSTLCGQAKAVFGKATAFLAEVKDKPAALFQEVTGRLESELGELVDRETSALVMRAQTAVAEALKLPPPSAPAPSAPAPSAPAPKAAVGATASAALLASLGQPCGAGDACLAGSSCKTYYGIAGPAGPAFKSCEIACASGASACPAGSKCVTVADGPGAVCRP